MKMHPQTSKHLKLLQRSDREDRKVLDSRHRKVLDKTRSRQRWGCRKPLSFLSLVVSRPKTLKLRVVDTTDFYFV
jgi:hypothetical protein